MFFQAFEAKINEHVRLLHGPLELAAIAAPDGAKDRRSQCSTPNGADNLELRPKTISSSGNSSRRSCDLPASNPLPTIVSEGTTGSISDAMTAGARRRVLDGVVIDLDATVGEEAREPFPERVASASFVFGLMRPSFSRSRFSRPPEAYRGLRPSAISGRSAPIVATSCCCRRRWRSPTSPYQCGYKNRFHFRAKYPNSSACRHRCARRQGLPPCQ